MAARPCYTTPMSRNPIPAFGWLRARLGCPACRLATRYALTASAISRYESGHRPLPGWLVADIRLLADVISRLDGTRPPTFTQLFGAMLPPMPVPDARAWVREMKKQRRVK